MLKSSYESEEIFILKTAGPSRLVLFFMLPLTLMVDCLAFFFYFITNLFSPNLKKIIKCFLVEIKSSVLKAVTGRFEVDQSNITSEQYEKLVNGETIEHPLYGKCHLIESQVQNFISGKTKRVKNKKSA